MNSLQIDIESLGSFAIAHLAGEIDLANAPNIKELLLRATADGQIAGLIIDLEKVTYFDSAGVRMLFTVRRELEQRRQGSAISVPESAPIRSLLKVVGVEDAMPVGSSIEQAYDVLGNILGVPDE